MGLPPSFDDEEREVKRELNELRESARYQQSASNLDETGFGYGSRGKDTTTIYGTVAMQPIDHELTEDDIDGVATGVFDKVVLEAPGIIVDNDQAITDQELRFIFDADASHDGQFVTLRPKAGKTLTVKSGGNIDVSGDILIGEGEFLILIFYIDSAVTSDGGYVPMLFDGSIAGGGSGVTFPILYPKEDLGTTSGVIDLALNETDGHYKQITLDGDASLTFSDLPPATNGFKFYVLTIQDSTGGWVYTDLPDSVINEGTLLGQLQTAPDAQTLWQFSSADGGANWHAQVVNPQGGSGDNLGNHIAEMNLEMRLNDIIEVKNIDFDAVGSNLQGLWSVNFFHSGNFITSTPVDLAYDAGSQHVFGAGGTADVLKVQANSVRPIELRFEQQRSDVTNAWQIFRSTSDDLTFHVPLLDSFVWHFGNASGSFWEMNQQTLRGDIMLSKLFFGVEETGNNPAFDGLFTLNSGDVLVHTGGSVLNLTDAGLLRNLSNLESPTVPNIDINMNIKSLFDVKSIDFDNSSDRLISSLIELKMFHGDNALISDPSFFQIKATNNLRVDVGATTGVASFQASSFRPIEIRFPTARSRVSNTVQIFREDPFDSLSFGVPSLSFFAWYAGNDIIANLSDVGGIGSFRVHTVNPTTQLAFSDSGTQPSTFGTMRRDGDDIYAFTSNGVKNLADIGSGGGGVTEGQDPVNWTGQHFFDNLVHFTSAIATSIIPQFDGLGLGQDIQRWNVFVHQFIDFDDSGTPSTPGSGEGRLFWDQSDEEFKQRDDGGTVTSLVASAGVTEDQDPVNWTGVHGFANLVVFNNLVGFTNAISTSLIPQFDGLGLGQDSQRWNLFVQQFIDFDDTGDPSTPGFGEGRLFWDQGDEEFKQKNDGGVVTSLVSAGGGEVFTWTSNHDADGYNLILDQDGDSLLRNSRQIGDDIVRMETGGLTRMQWDNGQVLINSVPLNMNGGEIFNIQKLDFATSGFTASIEEISGAFDKLQYNVNGGTDTFHSFTHDGEVIMEVVSNGVVITGSGTNTNKMFRANNSTEIGFSVASNAFNVGSLGSMRIPYTTSTTTSNATLDSFFGTENGCIGIASGASAFPRIMVRANGVWKSVFVS